MKIEQISSTQKVDNFTKVNNNQYNTLLAVKVSSAIYNDFLELKNRRCIRKDSILLRPIIRIGIAGAGWLDERGLLDLNDYKLKKILAGLNQDEKAELFDMLKAEFTV